MGDMGKNAPSKLLDNCLLEESGHNSMYLESQFDQTL